MTTWCNMDVLDYKYVMLAKLEDLEGVRCTILDHLPAHKKKVDKAYNKHVWSKFFFLVGNIVWNVLLSIAHKNLKFYKWFPNWEGLYVVTEILKGGT